MYALMVHQENDACWLNRRKVWYTHTVKPSVAEIRIEQTEFEQEHLLLPGHGTTVVEYGSIEWERLLSTR